MDKKAFANVPETHKTLEYIESAGTQYINTGVTPNENLTPASNNAGASVPRVIYTGKDGEAVEIWNKEQGVIDQESFNAFITIIKAVNGVG